MNELSRKPRQLQKFQFTPTPGLACISDTFGDIHLFGRNRISTSTLWPKPKVGRMRILSDIRREAELQSVSSSSSAGRSTKTTQQRQTESDRETNAVFPSCDCGPEGRKSISQLRRPRLSQKPSYNICFRSNGCPPAKTDGRRLTRKKIKQVASRDIHTPPEDDTRQSVHTRRATGGSGRTF